MLDENDTWNQPEDTIDKDKESQDIKTVCIYIYLIPYLKSLPQMFKHFTGSTPASETTRLGVSAQSHS